MGWVISFYLREPQALLKSCLCKKPVPKFCVAARPGRVVVRGYIATLQPNGCENAIELLSSRDVPWLA